MHYQHQLLQNEEDEYDKGIRERIEELKAKLQVRQRDKQVIQALSSQQIKDNEEKIRGLEQEVKKFHKHMNDLTGPFAEERLILKGLQSSKTSQLALKRKSVHEAVDVKQGHVFEKVKQLNLLLYKKAECYEKMEELKEKLDGLQPNINYEAEREIQQKMRILKTTKDKMVMKVRSAKFIEKIYKQIMCRLDKDCTEQPRKLRRLEARVKQLQDEVNSLFVTTLNGSKMAYAKAKKDKETLELSVLRQKQSRDKSIAEIRRNYKNIKLQNAFEDRDMKFRKQKTLFTFSAIKPSMQTDNKYTAAGRLEGATSSGRMAYFEKIKGDMDQLLDVTSVTNLDDMASCLRHQTRKTRILESFVTRLIKKRSAVKQTRDNFTKDLDQIKLGHRSLLDETRDAVGAGKTKIELKEAERKQLKETLESSEITLSLVAEVIKEIKDKIVSWDLSKKESQEEEEEEEKAPRLNVGRPAKAEDYTDVVKTLAFCEARLEELNDNSFTDASSYSFSHITMEVLHALQELENQDRTFDILVTMQSGSKKNSRVSFGFIHNFYMENFLFHDHDDNDQFVSREMIKQHGENLLKAKAATSKRKKKQK